MPEAVTTETPDLSDDMSVLESLFEAELSGDEPKEVEEDPEEAVEEAAEEEEEVPEEADAEPEGEDEEEASEEEAPAEEAAEEAAEEERKTDPDTEGRLERIAATERELSRRRREFDAQRAELARMEEAVKRRQEEASKGEEFMRELTSGDPLKALQSVGINFKKLAEGVATGQGLNPNRELESRQEKLERELAEFKQAEVRAREEAVAAKRKSAALAEISEKAVEMSSVISAMGSEGAQMVYGLAETLAQETGKVPGYDTLFEDAENRILDFVTRFKDVPKIRALFGAPESGKQTNKQAATKTVSNRTATKVAKRKNQDVDLHSLSDEEQYDLLFG